MPFRIAIGGFQHETHSFAPRKTGWSEFMQPGDAPPLQSGPAMIKAFCDTTLAIAGALHAAEAAHAEIVPLTCAYANPAGPIDDETFERIAALICAGLTQALMEQPVDGVFLDLHGAALVASFPDADGELLRRVRSVVGGVPVVCSLDPHANLTARMVAACDAIVPYRTYPHVDMKEAGATGIELLLRRITAAKPLASAFRQLDFLIPITSQCTLHEPMQNIIRQRDDLAAQDDVAEVAWCFGFPYSDFADCGPALAVYAETPEAAARVADSFLDMIRIRESEFHADILPAAEAVAAARRNSGKGLVIIADTQDNPGGGGHGDTTGLLRELIEQEASGAVFCLINDPESAAACHAAGVGAVLSLSLGGKSDGIPVAVTARVQSITDGKFRLTGPMGAGNPANLGPTALIEVNPGIRVMVVSRKMQVYDQAILRHVGIEPRECPIIALKSSVHFRADFGELAAHIIIAASPGPVVADPRSLPFQHLRTNLKRYPGNPAAT